MRQIIVTFTVMKWSWNEVTMTYMSGTNFFQKHQTVCSDICAMHNRFYVEGIRIYVPILQRTNNAYEMKLHRSLVKYFFYNLQTWLPLSLSPPIQFFFFSFFSPSISALLLPQLFFFLSLLSSNLAFPCHNSFFSLSSLLLFGHSYFEQLKNWAHILATTSPKFLFLSLPSVTSFLSLLSPTFSQNFDNDITEICISHHFRI